MKNSNSYGQFCPVARAAEIIASRWTPILLRELLAGSTKFNHLRQGVPRMSPALLSKRLIELEDAGIVQKKKVGNRNEYFITDLGKELAPVVMTLGTWGQKYIIRELARHELDPGLLMWDIHRRIDASYFTKVKCFVVEFYFYDAEAARRNWWLVIENGEVDLCVEAPEKVVDLYVSAKLKEVTQIWMGHLSIEEAKNKKLISFKGPDKNIRSFKSWFTLSVFADIEPVLSQIPKKI